MQESQSELEGEGAGRRVWAARLLYAATLLVVAGALAEADSHGLSLRAHAPVLGALVALSACDFVVSRRSRVTQIFDLGIALALVAVALDGPVAGLLVAGVPELLQLARRRRAFCNIGLIANVVSLVVAVLAGDLVLHAFAGPVPVHAFALPVAGVVMVLANYAFARLLLAVVRDRERPGALLRRELLSLLPLELATIAVAVAVSLALPVVGVACLFAFVVVAYAPQLAAAQLLRVPSVAALTVEQAAALYRGALADELRLSRADRRLVEVIDALAQRRPGYTPPPDAMIAVQDALLVTICDSRPPTQPYFTAPIRAQVVVLARAWAQFTARCTPALSHGEALAELHSSAVARDAPAALAAAERVVAREAPLSSVIAAAPRLHRAPLPRAIRHELLPQALARLAG